MSTHSSARRTPALLLVLASLLSSLAFGTFTAAPADAATIVGSRVVIEASHHKGAPYKWGAAGPTRFDCSGFTMYVFRKFGRSLPHNAAQQYNAVRHIAKTSEQVGDLLFFRSNGRITHVAIYAGKHRMWHAPHTGSYVEMARIYSTSYFVGRP